MSESRARGNMLDKCGDGQKGTPWMLTVDHPVEEAFQDGFLAPVIGNLMAGDDLQVVRFDGNRLSEWVHAKVVERDIVTNEIRIVATSPVMADKPLPMEVQAEKEVNEEGYVPEDCEVEWKGRGLWAVVGASGEIYAKGIADKTEAQSIARGDLPLKEAA